MRKISPFLHCRLRDYGVVLVDSLSMEILYVGADRLPEVAGAGFPIDVCSPISPQEDLATALARARMLPRCDHDSQIAHYATNVDQLDLRTLFVIPTFDCNLSCRYCSISKMGYKHRTLSCEQLEKGIQAFLQSVPNSRSVNVVFFGGEPLLDIGHFVSLLGSTLRCLSERDCSTALFTNATQVTPNVARLLAEHMTSVIVSADGCPQAHDAVRVFPDGQGSFAATRRGYQLLQHAGCKVGLSITVGPHNVDHLADEVVALCKEWRPVEIGIGTRLHPMVDEENPFQVSADAVIPALLQCFVRLRETGMYLEQVVRRFRPLIQMRPILKDCASCGGKLVLAPSGAMGPCEYFASRGIHTFPASPSAGESPTVKTWRSLSPLTNSTCFDCFALGICGGGCPYNSFLLTGRLSGRDVEFCRQVVNLLDWAIDDIFNHAGGTQALAHTGILVPNLSHRRALIGRMPLYSPMEALRQASTHGQVSGTQRA